MTVRERRRPLASALLVAGTTAGVLAGAQSVATAQTSDGPRIATVTGDRHQGLPGQYQVAVSSKTGKLYMTSTIFPEKKGETLVNGAATIAEVDATTLKVTRGAALPVGPIPTSAAEGLGDVTGLSAPRAAFGIAVDDVRGLLWTTDTIHDTVSAYDLSTFDQVWTSPDGSVPHGHSISIAPKGDVQVNAKGGLYRVTGNKGSFAVAPFALNGADQATYTVSTTTHGDTTYVSDASLPHISVINSATGALTKTIPLTSASTTPKMYHSGIGGDPALGVLVQTDQGAWNNDTKGYSGGGVAFYSVDGAFLARLDGGQNHAVHVDAEKHLAYVSDFSGNQVRVFDLQSAKKGEAEVIGTIAVGASTKPMQGVNQLVPVNGTLLAVAKDAAYPGVTLPYGTDLKTGKTTPFTTGADSLTLFATSVRSGKFDPAKDSTVADQAPGYDLSRLPVKNGPAATGSLEGVFTGSRGFARAAQQVDGVAADSPVRRCFRPDSGPLGQPHLPCQGFRDREHSWVTAEPRSTLARKDTVTATLTDVSQCSVSSCSFNNDGCAAPVVTIAGSPDHAECGTVISIDARGGLPVASTHVGACQRVECTHNSDLLCTAESVIIGAGSDTADRLTYQAS